jgi:hypothetical protein
MHVPHIRLYTYHSSNSNSNVESVDRESDIMPQLFNFVGSSKHVD